MTQTQIGILFQTTVGDKRITQKSTVYTRARTDNTDPDLRKNTSKSKEI